MAKIKGVLRRTYGEYAKSNFKEIYEIEGVYLYKNQNAVEYRDNKIELSKKEFSLLYILMTNLNDIVSRDTLLEELWDDIEFVDDNTLSVNIARVRKRLEDIGIYDAIQTKRGQGYSMIKTWD
nr:response regulator transcription factor [Tissierella simiarum]